MFIATRRTATFSAMFAKNQPRSPVMMRSCSRSSGRLSLAFARAAIALNIAGLLWGREEGRLKLLHYVADPHPAGHEHGAVHAEGQGLLAPLAAVAGKRSQRVDGREAGVGIV